MRALASRVKKYVGRTGGVAVGVVALGWALSGAAFAGDAYDEAPIRYSETTPAGPVARLEERLGRGEARLEYSEGTGYLESLLRVLEIPASSQTLVFSKTSLQRERISPKRPRALYFNDETYVGYVRDGEVIEIATSDPKLGAVFYTLDQRAASRPQLVRQTDNCLQCHGSSMTRQVPGLLVRSVRPDDRGLPILRAGTHLTTQESPLKERWGGWYVTGTHGGQMHMGNTFWDDPGEGDVSVVAGQNSQNVTDLKGRFDVSHYPTDHSDIVALMVLEHQAEAHNLMTRANYGAQQAMYDAKIMNEALKRPEDFMSDSTRSRIRSVGEPLVKYLLFAKETALTEKVAGTSGFAGEFEKRGVRDSKGRSLREFDLKTRMFRYPCSYLIYSEAFNGLPGEMKEYVWRRLFEVLSGKETGKEFAHLSAEDRRACLEIIRETKEGLPGYWMKD